MSTGSDEKVDRKRKKMRKGTHSCEGCRSRKVRCIFSPNALACDDCLRRGTPCTEQGQTMPAVAGNENDTIKDIPQWFNRIERSLQEMSRKVDLLHDGRQSADLHPPFQPIWKDFGRSWCSPPFDWLPVPAATPLCHPIILRTEMRPHCLRQKAELRC